jgi:predicted histone-like DNA-binding protein
MSKINYSLVQRRNPSKKDAPKLYYANAQKSGDLTFSELKSQIAHSTTATAGDVALVVESLLKVISDALKDGKSVFLDQFGQFRMTLCSKGAATMKDFHTEMIKGVRILFHPCKELKPMMKDLLFEQKITVKEQKEQLRAKLKESKPVVTPTQPETKPDTKPTNPGGKPGDPEFIG